MDRVFQDLTGNTHLTPDDLASVEDVLNGALAVKNKELSVSDFMKLGAVEYQGRHDPEPLASPAYTRFLATGLGSRTDPRWHALQRILDWVVRKQHVVTRQGVYQAAELHAHDDAIRYLRAGTTDRRDAA